MGSPPRIEIVSATRLTQDEFRTSPLGVSLARMERDPRLVSHIAFENRRGLPEVYNGRIDSPDAADILVFVHDDVWIEDFYFADRVSEGLAKLDVIGLAGNSRRYPGQYGWAFSKGGAGLDTPFLRGAISHGDAPLGAVSFYGPTPAECELLDGVFLAARKSTLIERGVRFDPRFDFHFYDLDFCRTARRAGLRLGVWPIAMTHRSGGAFGSLAHKDNGHRYFAKWGS